jgi:hypothetical protein
MKSPSLDLFYVDLDRHIRLVEGYIEVPGFGFIIRACRLKPSTYVFEKKDRKLFLYRKWFDEFGNLLHINNDRSITIHVGDLSLKRGRIINTDLYYGLSMKKCARISNLVHIYHGTTELLDPFVFMTFLGIDNYLRCHFYCRGEWQQVSPLLLGMESLLKIADNRGMNYFAHWEGKEQAPIPCVSACQWTASLPPPINFLSSLHKESEIAFNVLTGVFDGQ